MVHYGKHIIDHETGLCEICDRGAIHDFRRGKRPGRQFLYSNHDGKFTYRPLDDENYQNHQEETTPRYVRKPLYPEPPPARARPVVHEEPVVQKKVPRRHQSPVEDQQPHDPRLTTFYYVDNIGQMHPRNEGPPEEPRQRYLVQNQHHSPPQHRPPPPPPQHHSHPTRTTRVVQRRRAQTPPPPASETWRTRPQRQNYSDTDIVQQHSHQTRPNDVYYDHPTRKVELYYIERPRDRDHDRYTTISSLVQHPHEQSPLSQRSTHRSDTNRKQRPLEPIERKPYTEPEPTVVRKVYKKLPTSRSEPSEHDYTPNENHGRPVRKVEKHYPSPRTYESSPQLTNRHIRSPLPNKYPSTYHIQSGY